MKKYLQLLPFVFLFGCSNGPEAKINMDPFGQLASRTTKPLPPTLSPTPTHVLVFAKDGANVFIKKCATAAFNERNSACTPEAGTLPASVAASDFVDHVMSTFSVRSINPEQFKKSELHRLGVAAQSKKISDTELNREKKNSMEFYAIYCQLMAATNCDQEQKDAATFKKYLATLKWNRKSEATVSTLNELLTKMTEDLINKDQTLHLVGSTQGPFANILSSYVMPMNTDMKFVKIKPGKFQMGSPDSDKERWGDEEKQVDVELTKPYEIQDREVTQQQWFSIMGTNPAFFSEKKYCPESFKNDQGVAMCPNHPVESVSHNDLTVFIAKLNKRDKSFVYRAPTEAEWEYAARAGSKTIYSFGNTKQDLENYAWFDKNSKAQTQAVATKAPNAWGIYDMHGNVWEWTGDLYVQRSLSQATDPSGPSNGSNYVDKGGSWFFGARGLRSASRCVSLPGYRARDMGFRLVRTAK